MIDYILGKLNKMNFFKKQLKTKYCLIKTVELTNKGWETRYHVEVDDHYVSNSTSEVKENVDLFFEKILENKGATTRKEILREERV